jgi:hypothetical protein
MPYEAVIRIAHPAGSALMTNKTTGTTASSSRIAGVCQPQPASEAQEHFGARVHRQAL